MNLGSTWSEAIETAYTAGYNAWDGVHAPIIDRVREAREEEGEDAANELLNEYDFVIFEDDDYREFAWDIEMFYDNHMSVEQYERYTREEAVAEDLHIAFEAGARHAIMGKECDLSTVSMLHGGEEADT